jgi:GntR family transcriptional regulator
MANSNSARERGRRMEFRLDPGTGVPVYRQIIDMIFAGLASGSLRPGDQLPTVRQLAVDLEINPNTVIRAYRELELRGVIDTEQGSGTFIAEKVSQRDDTARQKRLDQLVTDFVSRAGAEGFTLKEALERLSEMQNDRPEKRRR